MKSTSEYLDIINSALASLDLDREPKGLYGPVRYTLEGGGKRLRPVLALAVADAAGGIMEDALPAALAVEVFHNFTLLHDDIMDKSPTRRGRPTVYVRWDEPTAILSGDAMLTYATDLLLRSPNDRVAPLLAAFNEAAMAVYEGQQLDMDFEKRDDVSVDEYIAMITGKTSSLIAGACVLGAVAAGADGDTVERFRNYGHAIGLAFQLRDDLLDSFGDQATFGKPIGGDILNDKKTWLLIKAREGDGKRLDEILASGMTGATKINAVKDLYLSLGLPDRCEALIDDFTEKAVAEIGKTDIPAESKTFFIDMAHRLVGRKN